MDNNIEKIIVEKKGKNYFLALQHKYQAQKQEALANLETYFNSVVAIGEHSDLLPEHDKWVDLLATASDKLETLNKYFELADSTNTIHRLNS